MAPPLVSRLGPEAHSFVLVGSYDGDLYAIDEFGAMRWRYHTDGSIISQPAVLDANNDGKLEVVFGSCDDKVYLLSTSGAKIWSFETDFWVVASPLVLDFDQDGFTEILVGSYDHNVYVLEPSGKYALNYVPGVALASHQMGHYGEEMTFAPGEFKGSRIWQYKTDDLVVGLASFVGKEGNQYVLASVKAGTVDVFLHVR